MSESLNARIYRSMLNARKYNCAKKSTFTVPVSKSAGGQTSEADTDDGLQGGPLTWPLMAASPVD